ENTPNGVPSDSVETVPIERVLPNPDQPRRDFDQVALNDLSASIKEKGILQPLIVRPHRSGHGYEIVAGERRWRAAQLAGLHAVPVLVRDYTDTEVLEVGIIENIQRAELNPVEEAMAYRQLTEKFGHTQEKLAEALGKSRSYLANSMRLLALPDDVLVMVRSGKLSAGHARALVTSERASTHAARIVAKGLTVRDAEKLVQSEKVKKDRVSPVGRGRTTSSSDADTKAIESDLSANLNMKVRIAHEAAGQSGVLSIRYNTLDELDLLCQILTAGPRKVLN
ncbi:MAG: ParB/RepB/Spo0J family partition protein, partial [Gemmobacter sp.]|nr:ParB/RepB/Spo0J family partition protein [Gemmobacter sp.]